MTISYFNFLNNIDNTSAQELSYKLDYVLYLQGYSKCSLRPNTALNILRAVDYAKYIGFPLNNFVTITFDYKSKQPINKIFSKIRADINRWLKNEGRKNPIYDIPPTWVFAFENKVGRIHVHWLIHIHNDLQDTFLRKTSELLKKHQGVPLGRDQIKIQNVNPYEDKTIANYLCKGVKPKFINFFHLQNRASFQGFIDWQRARVSRSLGPKRIKESGFNASMQRHEWIELHPNIANNYKKPDGWDINEVAPQLTGAKKFNGYKEYYKQLLRETSYRKYSYSADYKKVNGSIPRTYIEQAARASRIRNKLSNSISDS